MLKFEFFFVSMAVFLAVGIYLAFFTRNFLSWNRRCNEKLHRFIDSHLTKPVLIVRAGTNYARMQSNGTLALFTWSIRAVGIALIIFSGLMIVRIITLI
jgi:hypothetical protein